MNHETMVIIRKLRSHAYKSGFTLPLLDNPQFLLKSGHNNCVEPTEAPTKGDSSMSEMHQEANTNNPAPASTRPMPPPAGGQQQTDAIPAWLKNNPNVRVHVDPRTTSARAVDEAIKAGIWVGSVLTAAGGILLMDNLFGNGARERRALKAAEQVQQLSEAIED